MNGKVLTVGEVQGQGREDETGGRAVQIPSFRGLTQAPRNLSSLPTCCKSTVI